MLACLFSGRLSSLIDRVTEVWKGVRTHLVQHSQGARRDRTSSILSVDQGAPGPTKRKLQLGMLGRIHRQIKFNQEGFLPVYMSKTDVPAPQFPSLVQLAMPSSWLISRLISLLRALQGQRNIAFSFSISSDHTAGFTLHFVPVFMTKARVRSCCVHHRPFCCQSSQLVMQGEEKFSRKIPRFQLCLL